MEYPIAFDMIPNISMNGLVRNRNNSMYGLITIEVTNWTKANAILLIASVGDRGMNLAVVSWINGATTDWKRSWPRYVGKGSNVDISQLNCRVERSGSNTVNFVVFIELTGVLPN